MDQAEPAEVAAAVRAGFDPYNAAIQAWVDGDLDAAVEVLDSDGPSFLLPATTFARSVGEFDLVEECALREATGNVLDVGAGCGAFALPLHRRGQHVVAIETMPAAAAFLRSQGIPEVVEESIWEWGTEERFDTVLVMMNGTTMAGTPERLGPFLLQLASFLSPRGRILIDSTPVEDPNADFDPNDEDADEGLTVVEYRFRFRGETGPPMPQLFASADALAAVAGPLGLSGRILEVDDDRFLAALKLR